MIIDGYLWANSKLTFHVFVFIFHIHTLNVHSFMHFYTFLQIYRVPLLIMKTYEWKGEFESSKLCRNGEKYKDARYVHSYCNVINENKIHKMQVSSLKLKFKTFDHSNLLFYTTDPGDLCFILFLLKGNICLSKYFNIFLPGKKYRCQKNVLRFCFD